MFHEAVQVVLVFGGTSPLSSSDNDLHSLLRFIFDLLVLRVGLEDLQKHQSGPAIQALRRRMKAALPLVDAVLSPTSVTKAMLKASPRLPAPAALCHGSASTFTPVLITPNSSSLQPYLESLSQILGTPYVAIYVDGRPSSTATSSWWNDLSPRSRAAVSVAMSSLPPSQSRELPLYLLEKSTTGSMRAITMQVASVGSDSVFGPVLDGSVSNAIASSLLPSNAPPPPHPPPSTTYIHVEVVALGVPSSVTKEEAVTRMIPGTLAAASALLDSLPSALPTGAPPEVVDPDWDLETVLDPGILFAHFGCAANGTVTSICPVPGALANGVVAGSTHSDLLASVAGELSSSSQARAHCESGVMDNLLVATSVAMARRVAEAGKMSPLTPDPSPLNADLPDTTVVLSGLTLVLICRGGYQLTLGYDLGVPRYAWLPLAEETLALLLAKPTLPKPAFEQQENKAR